MELNFILGIGNADVSYIDKLCGNLDEYYLGELYRHFLEIGFPEDEDDFVQASILYLFKRIIDESIDKLYGKIEDNELIERIREYFYDRIIINSAASCMNCDEPMFWEEFQEDIEKAMKIQKLDEEDTDELKKFVEDIITSIIYL